MKIPVFLTTILLSLQIATAQVNAEIQPLSSVLPAYILPSPVQFNLPEFNLAKAEMLDKEDTKYGRVPKIGRSVYTNITLDNSGNWSELANGDRIWRIQLNSTGAKALIPYYNQFYLPMGATLHVYSPDMSQTIGAFTSINNPESGYYCTGLINGESCVLEYFEPKEAHGQGRISLNEVGYVYKSMSNGPVNNNNNSRASVLGFRESANCEVNVNCSEGDNWKNQINAVACILGKSGGEEFLCSGSLINNAKEDCTPYFLSAQHCAEGTIASDFAQWAFYFNYQSPNCNTPFTEGQLANQFISGSTKVADSHDNGGDDGSDFLLLKLSQNPPSSFNAYYAGWSRVNTAPSNGVCIHHPMGDLKKISAYTSSASSTWGGTASGTHWELLWDETTNGRGVTEEGSSGSPLFNQQGYIVGHLTGGYSFCDDFSDTATDYYGKISYDWTSNSNTQTRQLKPWLDPNGTNITSLAGKTADCSVGIAEVANKTISLSVVPNPSEGVFRLGFIESGEKQILVFDLTGKLVREIHTGDREVQLDLSNHSKGIYTVIAETSNGKAAKKLVLQ